MIEVNNINEIIIALNNNFPVCFKTDTIWGLSTNPTQGSNVKELYKIKQRSFDKPLIYLISQSQNLKDLVEEITPLHKKLISTFWPGPLTIIFKAKRNLNILSYQKNKDTIALRMPNHERTQNILNKLNYPLPTTSVNIENKPSLNDYNLILKEFSNKNIYILKDKSKNTDNISSTIVTIVDNEIIILREGSIKKEKILSIKT